MILLAGLCAFFFVCGAGCRSRTPAAPPVPKLWLGPITIQAAPPPDGSTPAVDGDAVAAKLRSILLASGLVLSPDVDGGTPNNATGRPEGPPALGTVRINGVVAAEIVEVDRKGLCRAGVSLKIDTRPSDAPGAIGDEISATGEERFTASGVGAPDRTALVARVAARTAGDLLSGLLARARLGHATPSELHATIVGDGGTALREEAIRQAGARGLSGEATLLLGLLDDPEESVRDAALGALIALRDQRAVAHLARQRSLRDRREMSKILEAISQIGGEEARQYLSFVADGHEDAEIRQQAREARDRLARRDGDAAATAPAGRR